MASRNQINQNVTDVGNAWDRMRNLLETFLPYMGWNIDNQRAVIRQRRNY